MNSLFSPPAVPAGGGVGETSCSVKLDRVCSQIAAARSESLDTPRYLVICISFSLRTALDSKAAHVRKFPQAVRFRGVLGSSDGPRRSQGGSSARFVPTVPNVRPNLSGDQEQLKQLIL